LLKIGLPIFFTSYLIGIIDTFPKLYILKYGNESLLGIYAPVVMLLGAFDLLPGALSTYLYPKYSFGFGQNNNARIILKNMFKIQGITIISIVGMIIIGYFLLPYFGLFFPKYQQSMPYLQLALIIGPFIVHKIGTMIYVVLREMKFLYIQLVLYAITQSMTLLIIGKFYSNVLLIVMYASIFTAVIMFIFNVFLNLWAVKVYERHRVVVV
jgi:O-antigen/teichoic acid export membrane protein